MKDSEIPARQTADERSKMQVMMIEKPLRKTGEIEEREQSEWKSKIKNT
jgi:hypothetical protein